MQRGISIVENGERPSTALITGQEIQIAARFVHRAEDPALRETMSVVRTLRHDGRRIVANSSGNRRCIRHLVVFGDRIRRVLHRHGRCLRFIPVPLLKRPGDRVRCLIVHTTVRRGDEDGLRGQAVNGLYVLYTNKTDTDSVSFCRTAIPASARLVRIGRVVLLVSVAHLIDDLSTDRRVVLR